MDRKRKRNTKPRRTRESTGRPTTLDVATNDGADDNAQRGPIKPDEPRWWGPSGYEGLWMRVDVGGSKTWLSCVDGWRDITESEEEARQGVHECLVEYQNALLEYLSNGDDDQLAEEAEKSFETIQVLKQHLRHGQQWNALAIAFRVGMDQIMPTVMSVQLRSRRGGLKTAAAARALREKIGIAVRAKYRPAYMWMLANWEWVNGMTLLRAQATLHEQRQRGVPDLPAELPDDRTWRRWQRSKQRATDPTSADI